MLELDRVARFYGHNLVFKDVSCTFAGGSMSLLLGNNGAGKSSLLRIMAGLARPSLGTARFTADSPKIGYLAHATFVYPALTALENLAFWRDVHGLDNTETDLLNVLARADIAGRAHDRAGTFSRGMAQRLNLARILLLAPDILLLDEPGAGLDAKSQALLRKEVLHARGRGACVVLVSHDLARDATLADRILLLEEGRLAYDGLPALFPPLADVEQACYA
ncbi:MAG: ABC transporter ATP-binding protein [Desulfovibrio sp.]|jgi:heme exporter protein A|nr:ABC transporter ATP-binding protein [Desulfovibrio sp.]